VQATARPTTRTIDGRGFRLNDLDDLVIPADAADAEGDANIDRAGIDCPFMLRFAIIGCSKHPVARLCMPGSAKTP
jgi:hypothetical protein